MHTNLTSEEFDIYSLHAIFSLPGFEQVDNSVHIDPLSLDLRISPSMTTKLILRKLEYGNASTRPLTSEIQITLAFVMEQSGHHDSSLKSGYAQALAFWSRTHHADSRSYQKSYYSGSRRGPGSK